MNYWFWIYIFLVPLLVFSARPQTPEWWRVAKLPLAIVLCYLFINLAVNLKWDLIHESVRAMPYPTEDDLHRATADGANIAFARILGWLPAVTYVGWWELVWRLFYRKKLIGSKLQMRISSWVIGLSLFASLFVAILECFPLGYSKGLEVCFHILLPPMLDAVNLKL